MDNQEYKARLESCAERIETLLKNVRKDIDEADKMYEAEKSKLGHGDFGLWKFRPTNDPKKAIYIDKHQTKDTIYTDKDEWCTNASDDDGRELIKFGNIFDLMKEWGEDLEEFDVGGRHFKIYPEDPDSFLQIEEIWHKLGRMIFTRKRKQG